MLLLNIKVMNLNLNNIITSSNIEYHQSTNNNDDDSNNNLIKNIGKLYYEWIQLYNK